MRLSSSPVMARRISAVRTNKPVVIENQPSVAIDIPSSVVIISKKVRNKGNETFVEGGICKRIGRGVPCMIFC